MFVKLKVKHLAVLMWAPNGRIDYDYDLIIKGGGLRRQRPPSGWRRRRHR